MPCSPLAHSTPRRCLPQRSESLQGDDNTQKTHEHGLYPDPNLEIRHDENAAVAPTIAVGNDVS